MKQHYIHRRRILFGDCDPGGIIYTPRVSHFVIEANLEFLSERLGGPAERQLFAMGIAPPARSLHVEFLKPMSWDDELEVSVQVKEIRTHAFALSFDGMVAGENTFSAELTMVCISTETFKPVNIPDALRNALTDN